MTGEVSREPIEEPGAGLSARHRRLTWGGAAWLFVLVAIGTVQVVRRQWIDAAIFGVAAVVLLTDAAGLFPAGKPRARPRGRILLAAGAAVAVVLSFAPRHGVLAAFTLLAVGISAMVIAWPPGAGLASATTWTKVLRRLAIWWAMIWIAGCLWELLQFILGAIAPGGRFVYPALSDLLDPIVAPGLGQAIFAVAWVGVGVFLVGRGSRR